MKKTALFLFVAFALTSCIQVRHNMSDESILKERRQVASFERITLMGSPTVIYSQSDSTSVYVDAPADILSCLETTVEDNCLTIRFRDELKNIVNFSMIDADDVKVYVTSRTSPTCCWRALATSSAGAISTPTISAWS